MNIAVSNIIYVKQGLFVHILPGVPAEGNQRPMRLVVDGCIVVHHPVTSNIGCQNFFAEKKNDGSDDFFYVAGMDLYVAWTTRQEIR